MPKRQQQPETSEQADRRIARESLTWARERCAAWSDEGEEPSLTRELLASGAYRYGDNLDCARQFLVIGNTSAALAVAALMLGDLVVLMPSTAAGMTAQEGRRRGGAATRRTAEDQKIERELRAISDEEPGRFRSRWALAAERARRLAEQKP